MHVSSLQLNNVTTLLCELWCNVDYMKTIATGVMWWYADIMVCLMQRQWCVCVVFWWSASVYRTSKSDVTAYRVSGNGFHIIDVRTIHVYFSVFRCMVIAWSSNWAESAIFLRHPLDEPLSRHVTSDFTTPTFFLLRSPQKPNYDIILCLSLEAPYGFL